MLDVPVLIFVVLRVMVINQQHIQLTRSIHWCCCCTIHVYPVVIHQVQNLNDLIYKTYLSTIYTTTQTWSGSVENLNLLHI